MLADGSECVFDVFLAEVNWFGVLRRVTVDEADISPMIGMKLLQGCEMRIEVIRGGLLTIGIL